MLTRSGTFRKSMLAAARWLSARNLRSRFSYSTSRFRNRLNQLWQTSTSQPSHLFLWITPLVVGLVAFSPPSVGLGWQRLAPGALGTWHRQCAASATLCYPFGHARQGQLSRSPRIDPPWTPCAGLAYVCFIAGPFARWNQRLLTQPEIISYHPRADTISCRQGSAFCRVFCGSGP
jgi:hypothetical protein